MAAVWAFCVGVQAEGVDCLPSPKASTEDPTLFTTASPHLTHGGGGQAALVRRTHSRGIRALAGRAFTTSGLEANIPPTPHPTTVTLRPGAGIQIPDERRNLGPPPQTVPWSGTLFALKS